MSRLPSLRSLIALATLSSAVLLAFACGDTVDSAGPSSGALNGDGGADANPNNNNGGDTGPGKAVCAAPKVECPGLENTRCVDVKSDPAACGSCDIACKAGESCVASKCTELTAFVVQKMYLGDTDRLGAKTKDAWKKFGLNIDGIETSNPSMLVNECKLVTGAPQSTHQDGDLGTDNSWGKSFMPLIEPFSPTATKDANDKIAAGGRTPMFTFANGQATFMFAEAIGTAAPAPKFDGTDQREIAADWTDGTSPLAVFPKALLGPGAFSSNASSTKSVLFSVPIAGDELVFPVYGLEVVMDVDSSGNGVNGQIYGVILATDLQASIQKFAGRLSTSLCSGSTLDAIKTSVKQTSDILIDGTQDPTKECNGISIGIGFEAKRVTLGAVAPKPAPLPDPCL